MNEAGVKIALQKKVNFDSREPVEYKSDDQILKVFFSGPNLSKKFFCEAKFSP